MAFKDVLGHERVKKILRKALQKRKMPNSILFCGPKGVGKQEMALVVARAINCERKKDDACEKCASCKGINAGNFPDVMVIQPDGNVIKIEQMRALRKIAYLKPMVGKKRVFIVTEAEKMNEEAANSLLKVLEEPPLFSYILLVTHNPFLILSTIKSRCQILNFPPLSKEDIERELMEKGFTEEKARVISRLVRGNLKQALSLDWEDVQATRKQAWILFLSLAKKENFALFLRDYAFSFKSLVKQEWEQILEMLSSFCRDLVLLKEKSDSNLLMNPDYEDEIRKMEELVSLDWLMKCLEKIDYAIYGLDKNLNVNLLVSSFFSNFKEWEYA
jgi:DNA polymerase III delta' subunit